jgi:HTH-type transcriptional regulator, cell division transcriptional repressor
MAASSRKRASRNIIGTRLKEARRLHSPPLTQDQLSGKLAMEGVQLDRVAIAKIETGTRCVFDYEIRGLSQALNVEPRWLLEGEGPQSSRRHGRQGASKPGV